MSSTPFWDPGAQPVDFTKTTISVGGKTYGPSRSPWDVVIIDGNELPGIAQVRAKRQQNMQSDGVLGNSGESHRDLGLKSAEVDITLTIWTQDHLDAWAKVAQSIRPKKEKPKVVTIDHPGLSLYGIGTVSVVDVSVPEPGPIHGTRIIAIRCLEIASQVSPPEKKGTIQQNVKTVNPNMGRTDIPDPATKSTGPT